MAGKVLGRVLRAREVRAALGTKVEVCLEKMGVTVLTPATPGLVSLETKVASEL